MSALWKKDSVLDRLEFCANWLTDLDWAWWPFLFLRPHRSAPISTLRVALMALYFGPLVGLAVMFGIAAFRLSFDVGIGFAAIVGINLGLFVLFRVTFAFFWNRRAARLLSCRLLSRSSDPTVR